MAEAIAGGFYIKARKIKESDIAHAAPCIREIWDYLLRESNHKDNISLGIKRGQCVRRLSDIQEGLHWLVGYRKETYSKTQCENAIEYLRKREMITTLKTTRGMIITVCNYDFYNSPENYEDNKKTTRRQQEDNNDMVTINKNDKNVKNEKEESPLLDWDKEKEKFLQDGKWIFKFCTDKKLKVEEFDVLAKEFISDLDLKEDYKPIKEIRSHFTNWFNKKNSGSEKIKIEIKKTGPSAREIEEESNRKKLGM